MVGRAPAETVETRLTDESRLFRLAVERLAPDARDEMSDGTAERMLLVEFGLSSAPLSPEAARFRRFLA
jgi:hypothetical protein